MAMDRKKRFLYKFAAVGTVIVVLLAVVLLQNSERSEGDCTKELAAVLSADSVYEAEPFNTLLLGEEYIRINVKNRKENSVYEIPDYFRCRDYKEIAWGQEEPVLWVNLGDGGMVCYIKTSSVWQKYVLESDGNSHWLKGSDGSREELSDRQLPKGLTD